MTENTEAIAGVETREPSMEPAKKIYRTPELIEWGSLAELTRGDLSGFQDFPLDGGSEAV